MVTQKDLQDAWTALMRGDEAERTRILDAALARDRAHDAARARGAAHSASKGPIKLVQGPDGVYRAAPPRGQ